MHFGRRTHQKGATGILVSLENGNGAKMTCKVVVFFGGGVRVKRKDANSTPCSQAVTHPSTNEAQRCLTSVIGRELVHST